MNPDSRDLGSGLQETRAYVKIEKRVETALRGKCSLVGRETRFPGYVAEVKGPEDWSVIAHHHHLRSENWPIMVPTGHWPALIRSIPGAFTTFEPDLRDLIQTHHFIFYDPPELYRYSMPLTLISHALRGNRSQARRYWAEAIEEDDAQAALGRLPEFQRRFVEAQWDLAIWQKFQQPRKTKWKTLKQPSRPSKTARLDAVWSSVDQEYLRHIQEMLEEASVLPSASFIPPVPALKASSSQAQRQQVVRMNRASAFLTRSRYQLTTATRNPKNMAWPWLSLYIDSSCVGPGSEKEKATGDRKLLEIIRSSFDTRAHVGIAMTIHPWNNLKNVRDTKDRLLRLLEDLVDFTSARGVPILLPRSGYYGLEMLDHGVTFFGSRLSGAPKYPSNPGMSKNPLHSFGRAAVYRTGDLSVKEVRNYLKTHKDLPPIRGLPSRPSAEMLEAPRIYRRYFSKPMRIGTHSRELGEISRAIGKGTRSPALRYLEDMAAAGKRYY